LEQWGHELKSCLQALETKRLHLSGENAAICSTDLRNSKARAAKRFCQDGQLATNKKAIILKTVQLDQWNYKMKSRLQTLVAKMRRVAQITFAVSFKHDSSVNVADCNTHHPGIGNEFPKCH
jgi:hypothetical protein